MIHPFIIFSTLEIKCRGRNIPILFHYDRHIHSTFTALPNNPHARVLMHTNITGINPSTTPSKHVSEVKPIMKRKRAKKSSLSSGVIHSTLFFKLFLNQSFTVLLIASSNSPNFSSSNTPSQHNAVITSLIITFSDASRLLL